MIFGPDDLKKLWKPKEDSSGEDNGQVAVIGGSSLFHGAPMLAVKAASRIVDMVFFGSPERDLEKVVKLNSFIWVPWEEIDEYVAKSDAVLIGPGMMRYRRIVEDGGGDITKKVTKELLGKFPDKKWVIDGGSLQVMDAGWIPSRAILTPNKKEFELLFNSQFTIHNFQSIAQKFNCTIVYKGPIAYVTDGKTTYEIKGGNAGLTKGGTGDTLAGIIVGLLAKNPPLLAAAAGTYLIKRAAERLFARVGYNFNADDVAEAVFGVEKSL
ncbi:NAD(P)H-hydrate dehydratase [Candidatus Amesbacteria bacterium]|nr:NAD(P)H-hydrate dehydratase [Candidatus Amesbacteria bacterium]